METAEDRRVSSHEESRAHGKATAAYGRARNKNVAPSNGKGDAEA